MTTTHTYVAPSTVNSGVNSGLYHLHLNPRHIIADTTGRQCVDSPRTRMDPPRLLEPRPTHNGAVPMHNGPPGERRPDPFHQPHHNGQMSRTTLPAPPPQILPSVREILSPTATSPLHPPYEPYTAQQYAPPVPHHHMHPQEYHRAPATHPPVTQPPRPEHYPPQPPPYERRHDLPSLETHSGVVGSHNTSPYAPPYRDHAEVIYSRPRQTSASSYATGSASSPYTPGPYDDIAPRMAHVVYEKGHPPPFPSNGTEATKRYLGIRDFPGEGRFHVYEGGHRLPTEVDGESVNPQWGLTKANKPRKRLAIACLDCREKKIKCEPGANSCLQCEKAKRPCRRGPSGQPQHENGHATDWSSNAGSPGRSAMSGTEDSHQIKRRATDEVSEAQKRQKSLSPGGQNGIAMGGVNGIVMNGRSPTTPDRKDNFFAENLDPVTVNPRLTQDLVNIYLSMFNTGVYALFPPDTFMRWTVEKRDKTTAENMVLHAVMAVATIYAEPSLAKTGEQCAKLASSALNTKFGKFSLQITQTRLLLALWSFAKGDRGSSWEHCGTAMRSLSALRLNNEEGCAATRDGGVEDYGLTHEQITECRRRTFWCGFMMDRLYGFYEGMLCTVDKADIYLRLPCLDTTYERSCVSSAPFFDNGSIAARDTVVNPISDVSNMAHLVLIISIWADVWKFVNRGIHRSEEGHAAAYDRFYELTYRRLRDWKMSLPEQLTLSKENIQTSVYERYAGEMVMMHIIHDSTLVKLNRCMRWSLMPDKVARNICEAHTYASDVLNTVAAFNDAVATSAERGDTHEHFSTPFAGYAVLSAIDVVSAGGHDDLISQTITRIKAAEVFLQAQGKRWASANEQWKTLDKRFHQLRNIIIRPYKAVSGCWLGREWGMEESLESELDLKDDCIYGVLPSTYFEALDGLRRGASLQLNGIEAQKR